MGRSVAFRRSCTHPWWRRTPTMVAKRAAVLLAVALFACGCEIPEGRSHVAFDRMVVGGVAAQQTLWDMHFEPDAATLNAQGQQRLCWILAHLDPRDQRVYVQALPCKGELTRTRIEAVGRDMRRYPEATRVEAVLASTRTPVQFLPGEVLTQIVVPGDGRGDPGVHLRRAGGSASAGAGATGTAGPNVGAATGTSSRADAGPK